MYLKFLSLLEDRGITSYKVAKETGISQVTLSDWKNGRSVPKVDKLQKIANYFEVPITYFLD
ncbi:helix-turn-helix domain-containing protein [Turicibacter sanguinis]|uniref:helix-turn-helix domain-containing protein n=1 Tax=Turicibacter sanguinis TaxID=154288 RepID=UPI0012BB57DA|nr:helix-turn-helix transcriptional regulator [Turicibacter sanguinis]MCU7195509.1 helix-turn-helix domain-containing protein [Turicibacter sanguinis]MTP79281.1 helix-turn-helix domain-containing protein [Turicibacter sanguinis]